MNCTICCHETQNALAAVIHLAKKVRKTNPSLDSLLLEAAIIRLDRNQKRCTETATSNRRINYAD